MASPAVLKGKERALSEEDEAEHSEESSSSDSELDSDTDGTTSDADSDIVTPEYLESLLEKARQNALSASSRAGGEDGGEEEVIRLEGGMDEQPLPPLDPGSLPPAYFELGEGRRDGPSTIRDPDVERSLKAAASALAPAPPTPPPQLTKSGKALTKKERKALKSKTAGSDWFDLPAPEQAELPRLYREVESLRLRNQLDPKRFYRKDEGEGKGIKGLPKYFAIGTIVADETPFGKASPANLARAERKRTLVDELVDDAEAKRYAKRKFLELQVVRGARGRGTLAAKKALRKRKW